MKPQPTVRGVEALGVTEPFGSVKLVRQPLVEASWRTIRSFQKFLTDSPKRE